MRRTFNYNLDYYNMNLDELNNKKNTIVSKFNEITLTMMNFLANKYSESHFCIYKDFIIDFFEKNPREPIVIFIDNIYSNDEYRNKILVGDDSFFLNQNFEKDCEQSTAKQIFQFKELWKSFDENVKNVVRKTFNLLLKNTEIYINLLSDISKLKKK